MIYVKRSIDLLAELHREICFRDNMTHLKFQQAFREIVETVNYILDKK